VATAVPFVNRAWRFSVPSPDGRSEATLVSVTIASPGYFETLGIAVRRGRLLTEAEHSGNQNVVVLNDAAARLLPHSDPIGRTLRYSGTDWTIVGVVSSARQTDLSEPASAEIFLPWRQAGRAPQRVIARIDGDLAAALPLIRARVRAIDPATPIADVVSLDERVARSVAADRFRATLLACLATIGLVLAVLGVWSVTSYVVARQKRENGIRAALGESGARLVGRMAMGALRPALAGMVAGVVAALWAAPLLETFLFEVRARDPLTLVTACVAVLGSALLAAVIPARRALHGDSSSALRAE
jgi:putative ABC transport system permease protein